MKSINDKRTDQCLDDIQKYEKWGSLLAEQCVTQFSCKNIPASGVVIHNGLEYFRAKMRLTVLQDNSHTDEDKEKRLEQIDIDVHHTEEILRNDLEYRRLLIP